MGVQVIDSSKGVAAGRRYRYPPTPRAMVFLIGEAGGPSMPPPPPGVTIARARELDDTEAARMRAARGLCGVVVQASSCHEIEDDVRKARADVSLTVPIFAISDDPAKLMRGVGLRYRVHAASAHAASTQHELATCLGRWPELLAEDYAAAMEFARCVRLPKAPAGVLWRLVQGAQNDVLLSETLGIGAWCRKHHMRTIREAIGVDVSEDEIARIARGRDRRSFEFLQPPERR